VTTDGETGEVEQRVSLKRSNKRGIVPGLIRLTVDSVWVKFEVSSQCLGVEYNDLIHLGNIQKVLDFLSGFLDFHGQDPLPHLRLQWCHVTCDVLLAGPPSPYIASVALTENPDYRKIPFKSESVIFRLMRKDEKDVCSLTLYDKHRKLSCEQPKSHFWQSLPNAQTILAYHEHRLRFELKLLHQKFIRQGFSIPGAFSDKLPPMLIDVLSSTVNPLPLVFEDIVGASFDTIIDELNRCGSWAKFERLKGRHAIVKEFNGDIQAISQAISAHSSGKRSSLRKEYRRLTEEFNRYKNYIDEDVHHTLIGKLRLALRNATLGSVAQSDFPPQQDSVLTEPSLPYPNQIFGIHQGGV